MIIPCTIWLVYGFARLIGKLCLAFGLFLFALAGLWLGKRR